MVKRRVTCMAWTRERERKDWHVLSPAKKKL
jgi:hypothetical protein